MSDIILHNPGLKNDPVVNGTVKILDLSIDGLKEIDLMESNSIPSEKLMRVVDSIFDQLGVTWSGDPQFWDPLDRGLGGGIFISNFWRKVE